MLIDSKIRIVLMNDLYQLDLLPELDPYAFYFVEGATTTVRQQNVKDNVIEISTPLKDMYEFLINDELVEAEVSELILSLIHICKRRHGRTQERKWKK